MIPGCGRADLLFPGSQHPLSGLVSSGSSFFAPLSEELRAPLCLYFFRFKHKGMAELIRSSPELAVLTSEKAHHLWQSIRAHDHDGQDRDQGNFATPPA